MKNTPDHSRDPIRSNELLGAPALADITQWLAALPGASVDASQTLFELLYNELRRMARSQLRREGCEHTLSATALTHELWFRMSEQSRTRWKNRSHYLAVAATMMRRILVNHELARRADKRDSALLHLTHDSLDQLPAPAETDLLAVHQALQAFEAIDLRAARAVELRYFGGLEQDEIAELLGVSLATVKRDLALAAAWLKRELAS
ncbi:MAG: sigma-70 family RNA polymerase sigma factor [Burkholderiales bacterium]|nr:sigma-70 family RNA polymerase sigma factor [Burkholderiales bacterium]